MNTLKDCLRNGMGKGIVFPSDTLWFGDFLFRFIGSQHSYRYSLSSELKGITLTRQLVLYTVLAVPGRLEIVNINYPAYKIPFRDSLWVESSENIVEISTEVLLPQIIEGSVKMKASGKKVGVKYTFQKI